MRAMAAISVRQRPRERLLDHGPEPLADAELLEPVAPHVPVTLAELVFGVTHEGAADVDDLLDRRTRIGLIPADRALAVPAAQRALALTAGVRPRELGERSASRGTAARSPLGHER